MEALAAEVLPEGQAYDWHQALMDLGATVCLSRNPRCDRCPVMDLCASRPAILFGEGRPRMLAERKAPYVVQPFEKIGDKWVAYGLGNSVARHSDPRGDTEEGAAARFRFVRDGDRWKVDRAEYIPTLIKLDAPIRLIDLSTSEKSAQVTKALQDTDKNILSLNADKSGLTRPGK